MAARRSLLGNRPVWAVGKGWEAGASPGVGMCRSGELLLWGTLSVTWDQAPLSCLLLAQLFAVTVASDH